ncbi:MAG: ABC transporter ATP-binding protein, partial [Psychrobacter sp.]|nr:ABC transporter ATP-binding protein [Psychrobacter sp.]
MSTPPRRVPLDIKPSTKKKERGALLWSILKRLREFARPYRGLFILTLILTVLGSFTAQVNAFVLQYTIDTLTNIVGLPDPWVEGIKLLTLISVILLVKEVLNVIITFGQRYFGERIRINLSRDLSQKVVDRILSYKMAFYTSDENASGKLQTRIDLGVSSLTQLVQNFFIDMLPLFASAIVSLIIMFNANFWVGMVGLIIVPIYFFVSQRQANRLQGFRKQMRQYRETKSGLVISIIDSITVIKSFVHEPIESGKHWDIQKDMTANQIRIRSIA